jgi:hypothetical protein
MPLSPPERLPGSTIQPLSSIASSDRGSKKKERGHRGLPTLARATTLINRKQESGCQGCLSFLKIKIPFFDKKMKVRLPLR